MSTSSEGAAARTEPDQQPGEAVSGDTDDSTAAAANSRAVRHRRLGVLLRCGAAVLFAAVLIGAAYPGWLLYQQHRQNLEASQALETAKTYAVTLTSADPSTVDQKVADIIDGATGKFKDKYTRASSQLRKLLIDNDVTSRGTVIDSAIKSAAPGTVEVLLILQQSVSNSTMPEPGTDLTPVAITMQKEDGRWLASDVVVLGDLR